MDLKSIPNFYAQPDPTIVSYIPKGNTELAYVGHAEITLALIDCDPEWTWTPTATDPDTGGPRITKQGNRFVMWGHLTVLGVSRLCVGTCEDRKFEPEKELLGDALRNGAMRFGIGTKLWSKASGADPAGADSAGGYDFPPPGPDPVQELYGRVTAAAGTDVAKELKKLAAENGRKLSAHDLAADDHWFELVAATLDAAA